MAKTRTEVLSQRRKAGICSSRDPGTAVPFGEVTGSPSLYDVSRQQYDHPTAGHQAKILDSAETWQLRAEGWPDAGNAIHLLRSQIVGRSLTPLQRLSRRSKAEIAAAGTRPSPVTLLQLHPQLIRSHHGPQGLTTIANPSSRTCRQ